MVVHNVLTKAESVLFYLLLLFLPTQLGKHFWPEFSIVAGLRVDYLSPTLYVTDILITLLLISWLFSQGKKRVKQVPVTFFIGVFLFFVLNILFSQNEVNGWYHLLKIVEFSFLSFYIATMVQTTAMVKKIFFFLAIGVIFQSLLAVGQFFNQASLNGPFYWLGERFFTGTTVGIANASINGELLLRPYGTFPHPNVLAGFLVISLTALLYTYPLKKTSVEKGVWICALLVGSVGLLLTLSRIPLVIWASVLVIVLLRKRKNVLFFIALAFLCLFFTPAGQRLQQTTVLEESFTQRQQLMEQSVQMFLSSPLLGVGIGNFLPTLVTLPSNTSDYLLQPVHSIFLLVLSETGILGFSIFFLFAHHSHRKTLAEKRTSLSETKHLSDVFCAACDNPAFGNG